MSRDTNFYYSFLVLPSEKRAAIIAVWDFCRAVDDAVDEAGARDATSEVERWRREVAACFDGGAPESPGRIRELRRTIARILTIRKEKKEEKR
jgi:phytoene synthase